MFVLLAATTAAGLMLPPDFPGRLPTVMKFLLLAEMVLVIVITARLRSPLLGRPAWRRAGNFILAGLLLSFLGDVNNLRLIDLTFITPVQTLLSVPFFIAAHGLYIASFRLLAKHRGVGSSRWLRLTAVAWPILSLAAWYFIVPAELGIVEKIVALGYTFVVVGMGVASLWLVAAWGTRAWPQALGAALFIFSDALIGVHLPDPSPIATSMIIWMTYVSAQLLIGRTLVLASKEDESHA